MLSNLASVLFYTDTEIFGGHEIMTVAVARHLCQTPDLKVSFAYYQGNNRLQEELEDIKRSSPKFVLYPLPVRSKRLAALRTLVSRINQKQVKSFMKQVNPDVVVISQGRIESSSLGLWAAKKAGFRAISYIPMAHPVSVSGVPFMVWLRERVNRYFYRLPDKIITINEGARKMLIERGVKADVAVVQNGIAPIFHQREDREKTRSSLGLKETELVVAVIGRMVFKHKAQDFVVKSVAESRHKLANYKFLFVGEGPDESRMKSMIDKFELGSQAKILPWSNNLAQTYAAIDMLLIPSKFEGVPLVMLEAMLCGIPVVASNVDGMAELLPVDWLFPPGDSEAMIEKLLHVRNCNNTVITKTNRDRVVREFSIEQFCVNFSKAIL